MNIIIQRKILPLFIIISFFFLPFEMIHAVSVHGNGTKPANIKAGPAKLPANVKLEIDALNNLSAEYKDSIIQFTFDLAEKALKKSQLINYGKGEAYASVNLGIYYYVKKIYFKSMESYMKALTYADANGDAFIGNEVNKGMEQIFLDLGRRPLAIEYAQKVWTYAKKKNNLTDLLGCNIILGMLMLEEGDTNAAFRYHFNALALKPKLTKHSFQIWLLKSMGNIYLSTKKYDLALYYYQQAIKENPKDYGNLNGTIYSIMAHTYEQINELENALYYNRLALTYRKNENQPWLVTSSLLNMGHTYLKMGNYDSSGYYIAAGLKEANHFKINLLLEQGNKYLYELCLAKKDWKNALLALQQYDSAQENVENEKNKDQVTLAENNRIISEKEKQAEELRAENAIQKLEMKNRNLLLLLLITLSFLAIALAIYIQQLLIKNKKAKKIVEARNDQLQDEIKEQEEAVNEIAKQTELLIKEVHHRVKNNLATLTSLVNMQKNEFTDHKTLDIFADLQFRVRAMALIHEQLYKSRNIEVLPIREYLSKLLGIVSSVYSTNKIEVHQDIYDEMVNVEITLPLGLIVNELLTNAFKYAFPDHSEGNIWVTYEKAPMRENSTVEMRCLSVRDDGKGLPPGFDLSYMTSMGSQIIYLLTQQLEGELTIGNGKGASFSILLPLEK